VAAIQCHEGEREEEKVEGRQAKVAKEFDKPQEEEEIVGGRETGIEEGREE
jgi:hypothetical protein